MNWGSIFIWNSGLVGLVFMIAGFILYKFPPKKINVLYGYRTKRSMSSQDRWDFAQIYSGKQMMKLGFALTLLSIAWSFLKLNAKTELIFSLILIIGAVIILFLNTEKKLKEMS